MLSPQRLRAALLEETHSRRRIDPIWRRNCSLFGASATEKGGSVTGGPVAGGPKGGMESRGVSRPMALDLAPDEPQSEDDAGSVAGHGHGDGPDHSEDHGHGEPYSEARYSMLRRHHQHTLWVPWAILLLGLWTLLAPFQFGYLNESLWVDPSGGRGVWSSDQTHTALRAWLMTGSDIVSGLLLVFFGWRALRPNRPVSLWLACGVGAWLSFAPLLFWAPTAAAYASDTLVGMLVISLTILVPGMPNMILYMRMGPPVPPGWTYNPSSWPQRWILIVTGFAGLLASRYLAMFQLGYVDSIWDPFFGDGTRRVLNSGMSHGLPISDAALGTFAYTFEFLMGFMGSPSRWRTMPWMVTLFGILVIPLGLVHILLVVSQPVLVGFWCTFCLIAAAFMLPMIPLEVDEVIAMAQHLGQSRRRGTSLWTAFWKGGPPEEEATEDHRSPPLVDLPQRPGAVLAASVWGMSVPWSLALSGAIGLLCMVAPDLLGVARPASSGLQLLGALVVVVSVICMGEVLRVGRYLNVPLGAGLALLPWLFSGAPGSAQGLALASGIAVLVLAFPRGPVRERYGSWDRFVR